MRSKQRLSVLCSEEGKMKLSGGRRTLRPFSKFESGIHMGKMAVDFVVIV